MSVFERPNGSVLVQEYDLNSFLQSVVKLAGDGYELGDTNEDYPQGYVGNYSVGMVKSDSSHVGSVEVGKVQEAPKVATATPKRTTKASTTATK